MDRQPPASAPPDRPRPLALIVMILSVLFACLLLLMGVIILIVPGQDIRQSQYSTAAMVCFVPGLLVLAVSLGAWLLVRRRSGRFAIDARLASWIAVFGAVFLLLEGVLLMFESGPAQLLRLRPDMVSPAVLVCLGPALALTWLAAGIRLFVNRAGVARGRAIAVLLAGMLAVLFLCVSISLLTPFKNGTATTPTAGDITAMILCGVGPALALGVIAAGLWMTAGGTQVDEQISKGLAPDLSTQVDRQAEKVIESEIESEIENRLAAEADDAARSSIAASQIPTVTGSQTPVTNLALPITNASPATDHRAQTADPVQDYIAHLPAGDYMIISFDHAGEAIDDARGVVMENAVGLPSQIFTGDRQPAEILATGDRAILVVGGLDADAVERITLASSAISGASIQEHGKK